ERVPQTPPTAPHLAGPLGTGVPVTADPERQRSEPSAFAPIVNVAAMSEPRFGSTRTERTWPRRGLCCRLLEPREAAGRPPHRLIRRSPIRERSPARAASGHHRAGVCARATERA